MFDTHITDVLCCAKSFYKEDLNIDSLKSNNFDIDIDITTQLIKRNKFYKNILMSYRRRGYYKGKKLRFLDGWTILKRIIINYIKSKHLYS